MAKEAKNKSRYIPYVAATAALMVAGTAWFSTNFKSFIPVPTYEAVRVFDGDTFETKEKQYIRISGIDAPELGMCGSKEAKQALEKLILGKKLYIKILYHIGSRQMGRVYTDTGSVSEAMLKGGWAIKDDKEGTKDPADQKATEYARKESLGIFSTLCTQSVNVHKPSCAIKGNVVGGDTNTYHTPGCRSYSYTILQLYTGDQWFCTEKEAVAAGFVKAAQCHE